MAFENHAAYLLDKHRKPIEVRAAPYIVPGSGELIIKNAAIAINPVDGGVQMAGSLMFPYIKYPAIMGSDVSGVVVEVGSAESGQSSPFQPGDRVVGHAIGIDKRSNKAAETAFQEYTRACVLPLGLATAACGLFDFEYVKSLGTPRGLDYKQLDTVPRIFQGLHGKTCAGVLAIGTGSLEACIDIVSAVPGRKFVSQASNLIDMSEMPTGAVGLIGLVLKLLWWNISTAFKARFKGVSTKFIWGSDVIVDEIGPVIYNDYLPQALASGQFQAMPDPRVVGSGLESVQEAINTSIKGVSVAKVVVTL